MPRTDKSTINNNDWARIQQCLDKLEAAMFDETMSVQEQQEVRNRLMGILDFINVDNFTKE